MSDCQYTVVTGWDIITTVHSLRLRIAGDKPFGDNNNINNNQDNVYGAAIMTQNHYESSSGSRDECRTAPDGCRPLEQDDGLEP